MADVKVKSSNNKKVGKSIVITETIEKTVDINDLVSEKANLERKKIQLKSNIDAMVKQYEMLKENIVSIEEMIKMFDEDEISVPD